MYRSRLPRDKGKYSCPETFSPATIFGFVTPSVEFLAPRTSLSKLSGSQRRIFYGLPDRSIGQLRVSFGQTPAGIEKSLPSPRSLLHRSLGYSSGFSAPHDYEVRLGFTTFQYQHSVVPVHPPASLQPSLHLHAGSALASGNLLALDPLDHTIPPNRVIRAHRTALANAQH